MAEHVVRGQTDCGLQDAQYRYLMAVLALTILRDVSEAVAEDPPGRPRAAVAEDPPGRPRAAMVMPAMKTPFPRVILHRTQLRPVFVVDPEEDNLAWQRSNTGRGAEFIRSEDGTLRYPLRNVYLSVNPFGLQHYPNWYELYPKTVLKHSSPDAWMVTLDWGVTRYEEDLKGLPGITHEIEFSRKMQLQAYGPETGWQLVKEWEYFFHVEHSVDEVAALLSPDNAELLRSVIAPDRRIKIGSSVIYRLYRRL